MGFLGFGDIFYQINYRFDEPIDLYNVFIPLFYIRQLKSEPLADLILSHLTLA